MAEKKNARRTPRRKRIRGALLLHGQEFPFQLYRQPVDLSSSGTVQYCYMPPADLRGADPTREISNFRSCIGFWFQAMHEEGLGDDWDQQRHYVMAISYALVNRNKSQQDIYLDALPRPDSIKSAALAIPQETQERIREIVDRRARAAVKEELDRVLHVFQPTREDQAGFAKAFSIWAGKGVNAYRCSGQEGVIQWLQEVNYWMSKYRKRSPPRVRAFINFFSYQAKASFYLCYANFWASLIPWLQEHHGLDDLNGDGRKDLLVGNTEGQLLYYANTGTDAAPAFQGFVQPLAGGAAVDLPGTPRSRPFVTDFNGDGILDVLVGSADGLVRLYLGQGGATGTTPSNNNDGQPGDPYTYTFDLDLTVPSVTINPLTTNDPSPQLSGTVNDTAAAIRATIAGSTFTATNNRNGTWTLANGSITPALADGLYDVAVTATDRAGNQGTDGTTNELLIDTTPPTSVVSPLAKRQSSLTFTVNVTADDHGGSGIADYDLYVSDNGGPFVLWLGHTADTSAVFQGLDGHSYAFYSIARDKLGNEELPPKAPDAQTAVGPLRADIIDVTPDVRTTGVDAIQIVFNAPVSGFDLADLTLTRNDAGNLLTTAQTLVTADNQTWILGNPGNITKVAGNYAITLMASNSGIQDDTGASLSADASDSWTVIASVSVRHVFYNQSAFDGNSAAINDLDDAAVATDKQALLPNQRATFTNYTSYDKGLNGIMVDIAGLPTATLDASDFLFKVGNTSNPDNWALAPAPTAVKVRPGKGEGGSDRIEVTWANGAITNKWLQVTVKPDRTGLAAADVFYFGNAIGETGNSTTETQVNAFDIGGIRENPHNIFSPAAIDDVYDINRDRNVNAFDIGLARENSTNIFSMLQLITPTVPPTGAEGTVPTAPLLAIEPTGSIALPLSGAPGPTTDAAGSAAPVPEAASGVPPTGLIASGPAILSMTSFTSIAQVLADEPGSAVPDLILTSGSGPAVVSVAAPGGTAVEQLLHARALAEVASSEDDTGLGQPLVSGLSRAPASILDTALEQISREALAAEAVLTNFQNWWDRADKGLHDLALSKQAAPSGYARTSPALATLEASPKLPLDYRSPLSDLATGRSAERQSLPKQPGPSGPTRPDGTGNDAPGITPLKKGRLGRSGPDQAHSGRGRE